MQPDLYEHDTVWTRRNREKLLRNRNLSQWYEELYKYQFSGIENLAGKAILEVGSGTSPLKDHYPEVKTSDLLPLEYLDYHFDCMDIDTFTEMEDGTIDIITMTNVLHHLSEPVTFLRKAQAKLKDGGTVIFVEPYFSLLSSPIFRLLHHEPVDFLVSQPKLAAIQGPLSSANMALPQLIFLRDTGWDEELRQWYSYPASSIAFFSALSYMATGGISRSLPIPHLLYRSLLPLDLWLARTFPTICASFFMMRLTKRGGLQQ